jgi:NAD+ kinase
LARIGLVAHEERPQAQQVAKETASWLEGRGHEAFVLPEVRHRAAEASPGDGAPVGGGAPVEPLDGLDLVVSLGGDGTMLRAVRMVVGRELPVLGVNFGMFGYLTAAEPERLHSAVDRFLAGDYVLERRMTVDAAVLSEGSHTPRFVATGLNDVVLARPSDMHAVHTRVSISGRQFLSYASDAMIVATATGSTGYNLSARGPIISPKLRCLVLTPVSPHMLFDRSMVLDGSDEVALRVEGRCAGELTIDGEAYGQVPVGERVVCCAGRHDALLVTFGDHSFETLLKSKFRLSDR